jgi:hypothetical protein
MPPSKQQRTDHLRHAQRQRTTRDGTVALRRVLAVGLDVVDVVPVVGAAADHAERDEHRQRLRQRRPVVEHASGTWSSEHECVLDPLLRSGLLEQRADHSKPTEPLRRRACPSPGTGGRREPSSSRSPLLSPYAHTVAFSSRRALSHASSRRTFSAARQLAPSRPSANSSPARSGSAHSTSSTPEATAERAQVRPERCGHEHDAVAGTLVPAQPLHRVGAQPGRLDLLGELLAHRFDLRHLAPAQHATDEQFLELVAVAPHRGGERAGGLAQQRTRHALPTAHPQQERLHAIPDGERAVHVEGCHGTRSIGGHRRLSIIDQKSGQLLETTSGSSTMMPLDPRPTSANAIASRWS